MKKQNCYNCKKKIPAGEGHPLYQDIVDQPIPNDVWSCYDCWWNVFEGPIDCECKICVYGHMTRRADDLRTELKEQGKAGKTPPPPNIVEDILSLRIIK